MSLAQAGRTKEGIRYAASIGVATNPNDPRIKALRWVRRGAQVLEIGCGHGAVTRLLKDTLGCSVIAVDSDPGCAPSLHGVAERFVCGDIGERATLQEVRGEYDHVLLMDVLEHLSDPIAVLRALAELVGAKATFIVTLPNFVVWHVRLPILFGRFEYTDTGALDRTHLRFFTLSSARDMIANAGLEVLAVERTWSIPILGPLWSYALAPEIPDIRTKVQRRFPRAAFFLNAILRVQHAINEAGLTRALDGVGQTALSLAPTLWTDHVVLLARPQAGSSQASAL